MSIPIDRVLQRMLSAVHATIRQGCVMVTRKRLLFLAGAAIALLAALALLLRPRADRINYANFLLIDERMPRDQVEAILGPPDLSESELRKMGFADFYKNTNVNWETGPFMPGRAQPAEEQCWISKEAVISVKFTNERAVHKVCLHRGGAIRRLLNDWFISH